MSARSAAVSAIACALCISGAVNAYVPATAQGRAAQIASIGRVASAAMKIYHLKALIVQVRIDGHDSYTRALGESMSGVPATPAVHFRNGAMAFTYMSTLLLEMVDRGKARLHDRLEKYFPNLPHAHEITLENLANMTSGYADYVYQPEMLNSLNAAPFRVWTSAQLIDIGISKPMQFAPGTNWGYSHTNYVILGGVLEKISGMPLSQAMDTYVFKPMGLAQTRGYDTPQIPEPVLHAFSSERRGGLHVPASSPFYEESTFWDPSWTTAHGAVQITDITDMSKSMEAVGKGTLLSKRSYTAQVAPSLVGFGHPAPNCPACHQNSKALNYGLGVVNLGPWITQTKNFAGCGATAGYLRSQRVTISVVTTYLPQAFDSEGNYKNASETIFASIANVFAPGSVQAR